MSQIIDLIHTLQSFLPKLRIPAVIALIIAIVFLPSLLLANTSYVEAASISQTTQEAKSAKNTQPRVNYDSPNAVADGLNTASDQFVRSTANLDTTIKRGLTTALISYALVGRGITHSAQTTASVTVSGFSSFAGIFSKGDIVSNVITPGDSAITTVPVIVPQVSTAAMRTVAINPQSSDASPSPASDPGDISWPIHGTITTLFGVPHWPYQATHTGIDISDGKSSGITPVHPFKAGRVIDVIHGNTGLGNHVIIDHGGGLTSVYGHMYSTAVEIGQPVDRGSILGLEGTTGASTGPHVHFEVRVNGTPVNPAIYVPGQP